MVDKELKYYKLLFDHFADQARLSDQEIANILKDSYTGLNSIKGSKHLPCLFPNCTTLGVRRSHLYSRGFLNLINEKGKFYSKSFFPNITIENPHFRIQEIGISKAMTFPGFCSECENKFPFERNLKFSDANDYFLQLFRTICYDKRILEIEIEDNKQLIKNIIAFSTNKLRSIFNKTGSQLQSISGTNLMEKFLKKQNLELSRSLNKLDILYQILIDAYNKKRGMKIYVISLARNVPFFAGYVGNFKLRVGKRLYKANVVLNIHHITPKETIIFFADFSGNLNERVLNFLKEDDWVRVFAEILACSNNWILKKSYWHFLSEETRFEVLRNRQFDSERRN